METKTTWSALEKNKIITSTANSIKTIKTIFYWEAYWSEHWDETKRSSHSHCLLRIYIDMKANRAAVIASELYSNKPNIGISVDFEGLALAIVKEEGAKLGMPLSQVIWIQHYGRFSEPCSYENLEIRDSFCLIDLPWNGKELEGKGKETVLRIAQIQELIGWINLEPVEKVLVELDAAHLSSWTSIDVEEALAERRKHWDGIWKRYG